MLTTRTFYPAAPAVVVHEDDTVTVETNDRLVRTYTSGRFKGAVEHTEIRLSFDSRHTALEWLTTARDLVANARPAS